MEEKQAVRAYVLHQWITAHSLLFVSITAGLFSILLFPDCGWAAAIPGISICLVTGWAAFALLFSASRVAEGRKEDEIQALFADPVDTTQPDSFARIDAEESSGTVRFATVLAALAMTAFGLMKLVTENGRGGKQKPNRQANQPVQAKPVRLFAELSETEEMLLRNALGRGAKVYTSQGRTQVTAIDFSSSWRIDDALLEEYSRGLPHLRILDLRNTPVTDAGMQHVTRMESLRKLRLGGTAVTSDQIDALRLVMPECVIDTETEE